MLRHESRLFFWVVTLSFIWPNQTFISYPLVEHVIKHLISHEVYGCTKTLVGIVPSPMPSRVEAYITFEGTVLLDSTDNGRSLKLAAASVIES